ncbi:MAG: hypothetical protein WEA31_01725 [Pirellulales bacterium]
MPRRISLLALLLLVPLAGAALGWFGNWWLQVPYEEQQRRELERLARAHESIPTKIGDWKVTEIVLEETKGEYASTNRTYMNRTTGEVVKLVLICGYSRALVWERPSPSVYVMDYADSNRGWMLVNTIDEKITLNVESRSRYSKDPNKHQTVCWAYSVGDGWEAQISRFEYGGSTAINKLFLANEYFDPGQESTSKLACDAFAKEILPVLNETLYGPASYGKPFLSQINSFGG